MRRTWRKHGSNITATASMAEITASDSPSSSDSADERKRRLLSYLNQSMGAAIVAECLKE